MAAKKKPAKKPELQSKRGGLILFGIIGLLLIGVIVYAVWDDAKSRKETTAAESAETQEKADSTAQENEAAGDNTGSTEQENETENAAEAAGEGEGLMTSAEDLVISHYADIEVQDYGKITVALSEEQAPETVANFVELAESGFYDNLTFHRIMDGFMIQGGDPLGNGTGGSDTNIPGEFSSNGYDNRISHVRGAISMARAQDPNSASSQFFIVQSDSQFLDGNYAGFGFVTEGMDVVDAIAEDAQPVDNNGTIPPADQPVIDSITIRKA